MKRLLAALLLIASPAFAQAPIGGSSVRVYESNGGGNYVEIGPVTALSANRTCTPEDDATPLDPCVSAASSNADVRPLGFYMGADNGSVLADADDAPTGWWNQLGYAVTLNECCCESDAGTPTVMLRRDDGSVADIFAGNLECSTAGACTTSFSGSEHIVADGEKIDFNTVSAGGAAKRWALHCSYTVP